LKTIVVISGKGGTGKTVIASSFAVLAKSKVIADADVDASNLYLVLNPNAEDKGDFIGGKKAKVDEEKCVGCGKCLEVCRFDAIEISKDKFHINEISCEGCGVCHLECPYSAIQMVDDVSGEWFVSNTLYGHLAHAKLGIAKENSGKLVTTVRQKAKSLAENENVDYIIIDGPPGIGCPVLASLTGVDLAIIVTEPTLSGINDMERIVKVTQHFGIKTLCVINKFDINFENTYLIEQWCEENNVPVIGEIPFDKKVIDSVVKGIPVVCNEEGAANNEIRRIWSKIEKFCLVGNDFKIVP
jgi:MinD superfamily P-loop ATPase